MQHLKFIGQLCGELKSHAIRVKEINAFKDVMICHPQHLKAIRLKPRFHVQQRLHRVHAKRDVVDPQRRIGRRLRGLIIAQVKKSDAGAVLQPKKQMGIRAMLAGAGHDIALDDVVQRQTQNVFVKMPRFLRIAAAVGVMV